MNHRNEFSERQPLRQPQTPNNHVPALTEVFFNSLSRAQLSLLAGMSEEEKARIGLVAASVCRAAAVPTTMSMDHAALPVRQQTCGNGKRCRAKTDGATRMVSSREPDARVHVHPFVWRFKYNLNEGTGPAFQAFGQRAVDLRYIPQEELDQIATRLSGYSEGEREAAIVVAMRRFLSMGQPMGSSIVLVDCPVRHKSAKNIDLNGLPAIIDRNAPPGGKPEVYNVAVQIPQTPRMRTMDIHLASLSLTPRRRQLSNPGLVQVISRPVLDSA